MKYLLAAILTFSTIGNELTRVAKANALKREAEQAYNDGDFSTAIEKYKFLVDSFDVKDDKLILNLSNAYYQTKDTTSANSLYQELTSSDNRELKSVAHQQMGIIEGSKKEYEKALQSFKQSLKANPYNEEARYNYELLKKLIEEQEQQEEQQNNQEQQDQENQEQQQDGENQNEQQQQDQEQKTQDEEGEQQEQEEGESDEEKEGEQKEEQQEEGKEQEGEPENDENKEQEIPSTSDRLKEMNISEEKARMILEAMKNNEIQYWQDKKRKAQKRKQPNKPDW